MLRLSVVVLLVLVTTGAVYASAGRSSQPAAVRHSCGVTDRQFLANYQVQLAAVGMYGDDYLHGSAKPQDVIGAAKEAARAMRSSAPFDPSLLTVRRYAPAMFLEFGRRREGARLGEERRACDVPLVPPRRARQRGAPGRAAGTRGGRLQRV